MQDILQLLEGMTPEQVKEFRRRIVPALQNIRREVTAMSSAAKFSRGENEQMYSDNSKERKAMPSVRGRG